MEGQTALNGRQVDRPDRRALLRRSSTSPASWQYRPKPRNASSNGPLQSLKNNKNKIKSSLLTVSNM